MLPLLITSFPNNINKIQKEGVEMHSFDLQTFTECLYKRLLSDTKSTAPALSKFKLS